MRLSDIRIRNGPQQCVERRGEIEEEHPSHVRGRSIDLLLV